MSLWKRLSNVARGALLLRRRQPHSVHPEVEALKPDPSPENPQEKTRAEANRSAAEPPDPTVEPPPAPQVPPTPKKRRL